MEKLDYSENPYFKILNFFSEHLFENISLNILKNFLSSEGLDYQEFQSQFINTKLAAINEKGIFLNFENKFISSLKMVRDLYLIEKMDPPIKNEILLIHDDIMNISKQDILTVILIGSAARKKLKPSSDLDFYVISKKEVPKDSKRYKFKHTPSLDLPNCLLTVMNSFSGL